MLEAEMHIEKLERCKWPVLIKFQQNYFKQGVKDIPF
jgi:hypothetical protein